MLKSSALSFHACIAGDRPLGPYCLSACITWCYTKLPSWAVKRCGNVAQDSYMHYAFQQPVSGTVDGTGWMESMAFSFPRFESHRFLSRGTLVVYCSFCKILWCVGLATVNKMDLRWFVKHFLFPSESGGDGLDMQHPVLKLEVYSECVL